ncbi:MAG: hypothetical protein N3A69_02375 [Leptospiraceae bacterium]|nr:hypothetical protein [Leptospiraceae bacterium]
MFFNNKKTLLDKFTSAKFFTWKKIFLMLIITQLQYSPCEVSFGSHLHSHKELLLAQTTKEPLTKKKDFSKRNWGSLDKEDTWEDSLSKDYYFTKVKARPAKHLEESGSSKMKMQSCYDAAKTQGIYNIFSELSLEYLKENSPNVREGKVIYDNPKTHLYFSCSFHSPATSFQIISCYGKAKNYGVSECDPIDSWSACNCKVYLYLPGGKNFLNQNIQIQEGKDL